MSQPFYQKPFARSCLAASLGLLLACGKPDPWFAAMPAAETKVSFANRVVETDSFDILHYPYLYAGAGVGIGDVNGDGWDDIFFASNKAGGNKLYLNKGQWKFEDATAAAGVAGKAQWSTGVCMADVNADGHLDIYVSTVTIPGRLQSANELYINDGKGQFTEQAAHYGLDWKGTGTQALFVDYDRDDDLDCFLLHHAATYTDDYQQVNFRQRFHPVLGGHLLRNDKGFFHDVSQQSGIYSASNQYGLGLAMADFDNDGWQDLYVSNDFKENDFCYINRQKDGFTERGNQLFAHQSRFSMGNDAADYNNDGWPDLITLDMLSEDEKVVKTSLADDDIETYNYKQHFGFHYQFSRNCLQQNVGGQWFADQGLQQGVAATDWSWAPLLADFNNDGHKDLFVSNGFRYRTNDLDFTVFSQQRMVENAGLAGSSQMHRLVEQLPHGQVADYFFVGHAQRGFRKASEEAGFTKPTLSNGAAYGDLDNDGDLDLVVSRMNDVAALYQNKQATGNHLSITLQGPAGNSQGIGAKLYTYVNGQMQMVHQSPVRGFMSSVSPRLHMGLGQAAKADSVCIVWPNGKAQWLRNVAAGKLVLKAAEASAQTPLPLLANPVSTTLVKADSSWLPARHTEDNFDDLEVQPLMPHSIATEGPALAVADVDGDGRADVYLGGSTGHPGQLWLQKAGGHFVQSVQPAFASDADWEATDAQFFDADADGDQDLYVCAGGNQFYGHDQRLADRFYRNDGLGNLRSDAGIPPLFENKSCVRPCDYDKDGDLDLFVGGRANARSFGYTPASALLQNQQGKLSMAPAAQQSLVENLGMITDACWMDADGDGWQDLIVAGEWMPITLLRNKKGRLQAPEKLAGGTGLWQCLLPADVDADGDLDLVAGNWGLNSKLKASEAAPLRLYVHDWDGNGEQEPLLAQAIGTDYYPFLTKPDLEKRLPFIKKKYLRYTAFAGQTMEQIFGEAALAKARLRNAETLASTVFYQSKGGWAAEPLPAFLQAAPLFSLAQMGLHQGRPLLVAGGNFYQVSPFEGRYDAQLPTRFSFARKGCILIDQLPAPGELRGMAALPTMAGTGLLLAFNHQPMQLLLPPTKKP